MTDAATLEPPAPAAIDLPRRVRLAPITSYDREAHLVRVMWSRGAEVVRFDWEAWDYYIESLDMSPQAVDLSRMAKGAPVLDTHQRRSLENVIGVVERAWLEAGEAYADIRLSSREEIAWIRQDVADGVIRNVSVGYDAIHMTAAGFDERTGYPLMLVDQWKPYEISLVPVGADEDAGTRAAPSVPRSRCLVAGLTRSHPAAPAAPTPQEAATMPEAVQEKAGTPTAEEIRVIRDQAREEELARVRDITATGAEFGYAEDAARFVRDNKSARDFRDFVLEEIRKKNAAKRDETRDIGMTDGEIRGYSISRAIAALFAEKEGAREPWKDAGLERAAHDAVIAKSGRGPQRGGILVPWDVQSRGAIPMNLRQMMRDNPAGVEALVRTLMLRDVSVGASGGSNLVQTDVLAGSFIDLLRSELVMAQLGARFIDGLVGNVSIPKQSAASTAYWLTNETTAITESQPTLTALTMSPKNVGGYVQISRQLLLQSNPAADAIVADDIRRVLQIALDTAAYAGSGSGGQPTGLTNTGSIGSVTGTSLAWAGIVEFQTDVGGSNALTDGCKYLTTPAVAGLLMQRQRFSSTNTPIWDGTVRDGDCGGYPGRASTLVTAATMAFGDWLQLLLAIWGDLEIARNDVDNFPAGIIGIRGFLTCDIGVRQVGAFSVASSIT